MLLADSERLLSQGSRVMSVCMVLSFQLQELTEEEIALSIEKYMYSFIV